ncbi:MAG: hypothetical protein ACRD0A_01455 [Acidimicrobiales bacterium]
MTPEQATALCAPAVDRVVIGVHLRSQPRGREVARAHGLERAGPLVEFRSALLAGPVARATAEGVARYFPPGALDEELRIQAGHGMLTVDEAAGRILLTERGAVVVGELYDVHAEVTAEAWAGEADRVRRLNDLTGRLLDAGRPTGGPAFAGMSRPHERPGDPAPVVLFNRLAAFRYHRADAHAAAWAAAGHTAATINHLAPGAERDAIEADTNRRAAAPYRALTADERLVFLAALAALP